jgi:3'(2'), 5'-bisphosphate nucleotidase
MKLQYEGLPMNKPSSPSRPIDGKAAAALIEPLTELVASAGAAILAIDRGTMRVDGKIDGSPVTQADLASDCIIADGLAQLAPAIPALSEERIRLTAPPNDNSFFLIDPLDGTREFVAGRSEFTVNLALVANGVPLLGIIGAPALGLIWRGIVGQGAERLALGSQRAEPIHTRPFPPKRRPWIAAVSRSHGDPTTDAFIAAREGAVREVLGSSLKFAKVAEGAIDIYPRLAPTHEWDIAAGCAIVAAAGGKVTDAAGGELQFGRRATDFVVPAFIAWGDPKIC